MLLIWHNILIGKTLSFILQIYPPPMYFANFRTSFFILFDLLPYRRIYGSLYNIISTLSYSHYEYNGVLHI